jgi:hypothetical protein
MQPPSRKQIVLVVVVGAISLFAGLVVKYGKEGTLCTSMWMCQEKCREGYRNEKGACWKPCGDKNKDMGWICRDGCREGYRDRLGVCVEQNKCPAGYRDDGLTCFRDLKCKTEWDPCKKRWPKWMGGKCMGLLVTRCEKPHMITKKTYVPPSTPQKSYIPKTVLMPWLKAGVVTVGIILGSLVLLLLALTGKVVLGLVRPKAT